MLPSLGVGVDSHVGPTEELSTARLADEYGATVVVPIADSFRRDGYGTAIRLASVTRAIHVSTGMITPYLWHPAAIAVAVARLQVLSGDRTSLMLGVGMPEALARLNIRIESPLSFIRESVAIIRGLFAGERVAHEGRAFQIDGFHLSTPPDIPPSISIAAMRTRMLGLAGAVADGVMLPACGPPEYVAWAVKTVRESAVRTGRDPATVLVTANVDVWCSETVDARLRRAVAFHLASPYFGPVVAHAGWTPNHAAIATAYRECDDTELARLVPDELVRSCTVTGSLSACRERLSVYADAGLDIAVLLPIGTFDEQQQQLRTLLALDRQ